MDNSLRKFAGLCGFIGPFVTLLFIVLAITQAPWFDFNQHWLSELGVGEPAIFFNTGLILGGIFTIIFSWEFSKYNLAGYILMAAGACIIGIGVFPIPYGVLHQDISASFFVLMTVTLMTVAIIGRKFSFRMRLFSFVLSWIGLIAWFPYFVLGGGAREMIASLAYAVFMVPFGIRLGLMNTHGGKK